ncbi:MAG TPA: 2-oxo-4-hydroxy-4-carboxy-5-ureidoimidazoline decarboxylase [Candidatus Limnocylindrales bacterium]|nr:2-oxo-4-hydroxy-4-carboxy-5-ureidoimidazoline decarboxylase [Candidatus Limnocylindrales bacterium]
MSTTQPIEELDSLPAAGFIEALAPLFEGAPGFLGRLAIDRPYGSWWNLFERARVIAQAMPEAEQVELLNAHPRLGAPPESVSQLSFVEQGYDRAPAAEASSLPTWGSAGSAGAAPIRAAGTPEGDTTRARLDRLNAAYEDWFGFRYCVFVAGRSLETLIPELEAALLRPRDHELHRGIDAVVDIAIARSGMAR